jgi:hypothetical protein
MTNSGRDIGFRPLPTLDWSAEHCTASVASVIAYVSTEAQQAIQWYLWKKQGKRIGARCSRIFAVLATSAAAIIPLVAQIYPDSVQPGWASIALVLAVAAIGLDRFFGYSSAWMRYVATEMQIRQALHRFQMQVEMRRAEQAGSDLSGDDIQFFFLLSTDFLIWLDEIVRDETAVWSSELRSILHEMEAAARVHAQDQRSGEIRLTVTNGNQAANGWTVTVDNAAAEVHNGSTATLRNVSPGRRIVQVRGTIAGQQKTVRKAITVAAGETAPLEMTLG